MKLTVINKAGWKKPVTLDKPVTKIGSASFCDIPLTSAGIAPVHLQLIYAPENPASCKVLNLGPVVSCFSNHVEIKVDPFASQDVRDGDEIVLGDDYRLEFHLPYSPELLAASRLIAATLTPADTILRPFVPVTAVLRLKNLGNHPACNFQVAITGIPDSCYQIDPLPILYPAAEEDVRIRIFHRGMVPPAGDQTITIGVTAPACYPGEQVIIRQSLFVTPLLWADFRLSDDMPVSEKVQTPGLTPIPEQPLPPTAPVETASPVEPVRSVETARSVETVRPVVTEPVIDAPVVVEATPPVPAGPAPVDISRTRIVHNPSETYWEE